MKPIRTTLMALLTAAALAVPVGSAEAHSRHRGDAAAAFAFGLFAGAILNQGIGHRHYYRNDYYRSRGNCYGTGLSMPEYDACMTGSIYPSYRVAPHGHHHYKKVYKPRYKKHGHSHGTRGFRIIVGP